MNKFLVSSLLATPIIALAGSFQANAVELVGRAVLPAKTFASGPTSGQFITGNTNGVTVPFVNAQPVQGISAVLPGPTCGTYRVMIDNGFGAKGNSADSLLRTYAVRPDFKQSSGIRGQTSGSGQVLPINYKTGATLSSFTNESYLQLNDAASRAGFSVVGSQTTYPSSTIPVDTQIRQGRQLTGADFDTESIRLAPDGTYWFGEEFGPYLFNVDQNGQLLSAPISLPNFLNLATSPNPANPLVQSPQNPNPNLIPGTTTPNTNLAASRGFEGMAINPSGTRLYALLEGPLTGDPNRNRLLINEFNLSTKQFTGRVFYYRMENTTESGQSIGDMTAINDQEYLVIERDSNQGTASRFKKIFKINLSKLDSQGFVEKILVADLLNISDPNQIGGNGTTVVNGQPIFTFPFVTIESVLPLDRQTLLVINDNNYPFSTGRNPAAPDDNEFILIKLDKPLRLSLGLHQSLRCNK